MTPTSEQLLELYLIGHELTAQLRCYIRLIELLPNQDLLWFSRENSQLRE